MTTTINPNDRVRVKLTDHGKQMIMRHIDDLNARLQERGPRCTFRAKVPEWDSDGWISDQFHCLMAYFDGCWNPGVQLPFTDLKKIG